MSYLYPPPEPAPVVVTKDVGGFVNEYRDRTELYRTQNREVRLHECRSACTLALSLPNVCVYPTSLLKFHQAYNANTKETDLGISDELWRSYPQAIRARLGTLTRQYKIIKGDELIALGMRDCNAPREKIMIAKARPIPPPSGENGSLLAGLGDKLTSLVTPSAPTAVQTKPVAEPARVSPDGPKPPTEPPKPIPEPPPRPTDPIPSSQVPPPQAPPSGILVDVPLPPRRPPMLAKAEPAIPAFRRPMPGSQRILQPYFVALAASR